MKVTLDEEHGVNPSVEHCFVCNEPKGVVLWGRLTRSTKESFDAAGLPCGHDGEAPRGVVLDKEPCGKCLEYMQQGVILISVKNVWHSCRTKHGMLSGFPEGK